MARNSTGEHFCQSEMQGTVENRSSLAGGVAFDILRCWKDDHLQTSEYSLQGKNKGKGRMAQTFHEFVKKTI